MKKTLSIILILSLVLISCGEPTEKTPKTAPNDTPALSVDSTTTITLGSVDKSDPTVKELLGVISGPGVPTGQSKGLSDLSAQFQEIGVTSVRNNDYYDDRLDMEGIFNCGGETYPSWEGCDATDDSFYNWEKSDAEMSLITDGGFDSFFRLGGEWENSEPNHDFKGPQNATQEDNWIIAAEKVVARYQDWQGKSPIEYLDIWTEFPGERFWDRSNKEFYTFWVKAYKALKTAYPDLKIGGPGFEGVVSKKVMAGEKNPAEAFLQTLYKEGIKPDWFGWHLFSNDPQDFVDAANAYEDLLQGRGAYEEEEWAGTGFFDNTERIVDAYGNSNKEEDDETDSIIGFIPDEELQAIYASGQAAATLSASWISMQYANVERAYYYRGAGSGGSSDGTSSGPGLFYSDGSLKTLSEAFKLWSQVVQDYPTLLVVNSDSDLWILAAQNTAGEKVLLLSNTSTKNIGWSIPGTSLKGAKIYTVSDSNDSQSPAEATEEQIITGANTVNLVILP